MAHVDLVPVDEGEGTGSHARCLRDVLDDGADVAHGIVVAAACVAPRLDDVGEEVRKAAVHAGLALLERAAEAGFARHWQRWGVSATMARAQQG